MCMPAQQAIVAECQAVRRLAAGAFILKQRCFAGGHLHVSEWVFRALLVPRYLQDWWILMMEGACNYGRVEVAQWLLDHGCPWRGWDLYQCARNGHLHYLQWMLSNAVLLNLRFPDAKRPWTGPMPALRFVGGAAAGGHLHILEWAVASLQCPAEGSLQQLEPHDQIEIGSAAASNGHLHILRVGPC